MSKRIGEGHNLGELQARILKLLAENGAMTINEAGKHLNAPYTAYKALCVAFNSLKERKN